MHNAWAMGLVMKKQTANIKAIFFSLLVFIVMVMHFRAKQKQSVKVHTTPIKYFTFLLTELSVLKINPSNA